MVVAHRTLVEEHLLDHVRGLCEAGECRFHLVVPVTHPMGAWSEGEVEAAAEARLEEGQTAFRQVGAEVTGEVGDANPVYAVAAAVLGGGRLDGDHRVHAAARHLTLAGARRRQPHQAGVRPARHPSGGGAGGRRGVTGACGRRPGHRYTR
jgi:hypothetical protein